MARDGTLRRVGRPASSATTQLHHRMDGFDFVREVAPDHPDVSVANRSRRPRSIRDKPYARPRLGHGDRSRSLHRLQRLRRRLHGREQRAGGRQGAGRAGREMQWLRVDRYFTGEVDDPRSFFQPVPCMHCEQAPCEMGCPVNATVHARRPQPEGLQSLHRHADLFELLPLQGAALQLVRIPRDARFADARCAQSRCHGALPRRHGEMHLLHPAHRGARIRRQGGPADPRRRGRHCLPAGLSDQGDRVRRHQRSGVGGRQGARADATTPCSRSSTPGRAPPIWRAGKTRPRMSSAPKPPNPILPPDQSLGDVTDQIRGIPLHSRRAAAG